MRGTLPTITRLKELRDEEMVLQRAKVIDEASEKYESWMKSDGCVCQNNGIGNKYKVVKFEI